MSVCDLSIELEEPRAVFYAGQPIKGKVVVQVLKDCRCKALTLVLGWRTQGKGNEAHGGGPRPTKTILGQGEWKAGQRLEFFFSIIAPPGPVSYRGHYINIGWFIQARADVPWAIDPKAVVPMVLLASPGQQSHYLGPFFAAEQLQSSRSTVRGKSLITSGVVLTILGVLSVAWALWASRMPHSAHVGPAVYAVPGAMLLLGLILFFVGFTQRHFDKRLGPPSVTLLPNPAAPGGPLTIQVLLRPDREITLLGAKATITGKETASSGSGSTRKTYSHIFHQQTFALNDAKGKVARKEERLLTWQFVLPAESPPTFSASDNRVEWSVQVSVEIHRWPDWSGKKVLVVTPPPGRLPAVP